MKKKPLIALASVALFFLVGYSSYTISKNYSKSELGVQAIISQNALKESTIDLALLQRINADLPNASNLTINFVDSTAIDALVEYKFTNNKHLSEGVAYLYYLKDGWIVRDIDYMEIDPLEKKVTVRTFGGGLYNQEVARSFITTSGVIKNKQIREIILNYHDGFSSIIKIKEDQDTFLDVRRGIGSGVKTIEGLDKNDNIIFKE